jgi:hypothetical protein
MDAAVRDSVPENGRVRPGIGLVSLPLGMSWTTFEHVTFVFRRRTLRCVERQQLVSGEPQRSFPGCQPDRRPIPCLPRASQSTCYPDLSWPRGLAQTDNSMMGSADGAVVDRHQNVHRFRTCRVYRRRRHFLHRYDSILAAIVTGIFLFLHGMLTTVIFRS